MLPIQHPCPSPTWAWSTSCPQSAGTSTPTQPWRRTAKRSTSAPSQRRPKRWKRFDRRDRWRRRSWRRRWRRERLKWRRRRQRARHVSEIVILTQTFCPKIYLLSERLRTVVNVIKPFLEEIPNIKKLKKVCSDIWTCTKIWKYKKQFLSFSGKVILKNYLLLLIDKLLLFWLKGNLDFPDFFQKCFITSINGRKSQVFVFPFLVSCFLFYSSSLMFLGLFSSFQYKIQKAEK